MNRQQLGKFFNETLAVCDESLQQFSREFYFPNMCHVCRHFGEDANLKRCGADWPSHKEFCKIICRMKQERKVDSLFHELKSIAVTNSPEGKKRDSYDFLNSLRDVNLKLILEVIVLLQRKLTKTEFQMIIYPRICAVCYESDPKLLKNCKNCMLSCFCDEHLNDPDHESECLKIRACFNRLRSICFFDCALKDKCVADSQYHPPERKLPSSMLEFIETRLPELNDFENSLIPDKVIRETLFKCFLSEHFSRAFTILFAMKRLGLDSAKSMVIHVLGATFEEIFHTDWEVIFHFLPQLRQLEWIFIGPEALEDNYRQLCEICEKEDKKLVFQVKRKLYHKYCEEDGFVKPDLIACFNANIHQEIKTWEESIKVLDKGQCPLLVTTFGKAVGLKDKSHIDSAFPEAKCVFSEDNPFTHISYHRRDIYFPIAATNGFLFIYEYLNKNNASEDKEENNTK